MVSLTGMTPRQQQGVMVHNVPAIVTAGAGAGKTRVLTTKVAKVITEQKTNIIAFSFTSKAANEIKERVYGLVGDKADNRVECRTFHSFALNFILQPNISHPFFKHLNLGNKRIDLCANNYSYLREAFASGVKPSANNFLKSEGYKIDDFISWLTQVRANASTLTEYAVNLTEIPLDELESRTDELEFTDRIHAYFLLMWRKYDHLLRVAKQIDFDEVLSLSLQLLDHEPLVGKKLREHFGLVLVDEFQDTNITQYRMILHLINSDASNLIAYGDIQQAIYGFRGGSSYIMAQFPDEFENTQVVNLPDNFRSTFAIVGFANKLSHVMKYRLSTEDMIAHKTTVEPVTVVGFPTPREEARWIADKILTLKDKGIEAPEICVLYRNKSHKDLVELELVNRKIKYVVVGDKGLFEVEDVKSIVAFLHCIFKPVSIDALKKSLKTISLKLDSHRLGGYIRACQVKGTVANVHALLSKLQVADGNNNKVTIYAKKMISMIMRQTSVIGNIKTYKDYLRSEHIQLEKLSNDEKLATRNEYEESIKQFYNDLSNAFIEIIMCFHSETVEQVTQKAEMEREQIENYFSYIFMGLLNRNTDDIDILDYIQSLPLFSDIKKEEKNTDSVELMTVHKSKGLERQAIILCGATQENWFKEINQNDEDDKEEVLRLFYVACTRAIQYQYITHFDMKEVNKAWVSHNPIEYLSLPFDEHASFLYFKNGQILTEQELKQQNEYEQFDAGKS